jgi:hypothetical protein
MGEAAGMLAYALPMFMLCFLFFVVLALIASRRVFLLLGWIGLAAAALPAGLMLIAFAVDSKSREEMGAIFALPIALLGAIAAIGLFLGYRINKTKSARFAK